MIPGKKKFMNYIKHAPCLQYRSVARESVVSVVAEHITDSLYQSVPWDLFYSKNIQHTLPEYAFFLLQVFVSVLKFHAKKNVKL